MQCTLLVEPAFAQNPQTNLTLSQAITFALLQNASEQIANIEAAQA